MHNEYATQVKLDANDYDTVVVKTEIGLVGVESSTANEVRELVLGLQRIRQLGKRCILLCEEGSPPNIGRREKDGASLRATKLIWRTRLASAITNALPSKQVIASFWQSGLQQLEDPEQRLSIRNAVNAGLKLQDDDPRQVGVLTTNYLTAEKAQMRRDGANAMVYHTARLLSKPPLLVLITASDSLSEKPTRRGRQYASRLPKRILEFTSRTAELALLSNIASTGLDSVVLASLRRNSLSRFSLNAFNGVFIQGRRGQSWFPWLGELRPTGAVYLNSQGADRLASQSPIQMHDVEAFECEFKRGDTIEIRARDTTMAWALTNLSAKTLRDSNPTFDPAIRGSTHSNMQSVIEPHNVWRPPSFHARRTDVGDGDLRLGKKKPATAQQSNLGRQQGTDDTEYSTE